MVIWFIYLCMPALYKLGQFDQYTYMHVQGERVKWEVVFKMCFKNIPQLIFL